MPAARESLLDAAAAALARRPWSAVRMVDVAASAGVSRQTLYNEFGGKDGLARALVRREADGYLAGVERALAGPAAPRERLTAAAEWTAAAARDNALVRAMLTGCWSERLPAPPLAAVASSCAVPAQRRADGPLPAPGDLLRAVRDRAVAALAGPGVTPADTAELARACELAVRLAVSCVAAPPGEGGMAELVRAVFPRQAVRDAVPDADGRPSERTPTAGGRSPR
ncbi:TetR family transcriptional regulator [Streptomyces lucensis JCM 4490]|uniref:TetR family transcriptional regulator n=1 Tax=Streptomyces lucensis JCM 4490 TaxID=1306176 RepID=A0A918IUM4_9ACTN|nr:TetR/AcrR family transcriptional regulator [Streptomyces lucensis]GGW33033.1 TetR family transcriptional regulator [Streptomyces lucensis JCM 4490]